MHLQGKDGARTVWLPGPRSDFVPEAITSSRAEVLLNDEEAPAVCDKLDVFTPSRAKQSRYRNEFRLHARPRAPGMLPAEGAVAGIEVDSRYL